MSNDPVTELGDGVAMRGARTFGWSNVRCSRLLLGGVVEQELREDVSHVEEFGL
jgi:hypothetical protein